MALPENLAIRTEFPQLIRGSTEFYEALATIGKVPIIGKPWEAALRPFERQFTAWGDIVRVELAKALRPAFERSGQLNQLTTYINRMTFMMDSKALGIQPASEPLKRLF